MAKEKHEAYGSDNRINTLLGVRRNYEKSKEKSIHETIKEKNNSGTPINIIKAKNIR